MKQYIFSSVLLLFCIAFYSCKKSGSSTAIPMTGKYKLTLLSGNNQTDTIGLSLKDSIIIKATNNDDLLNNYHVQFLRSGCNEDMVDDLYTSSQGKVRYIWRLSGNTGQQNLKIRLLDSKNNLVDSITVNSTGIAHNGIGWHISACTPFTTEIFSFCKLSTGRIFASFGKFYARYSDDNGISWFAVKALGNTHNIISILATPKDELIALADREGIYYSKDAGVTWTFLGATPFVNEVFWDIAYTNSGKLIYTSRQNHVYLSLDNGKTWQLLINGLGKTSYTYPTEAKNGYLYLVGDDAILYRSTDGGSNWLGVTSNSSNGGAFEEVVSMYCADNGWLYKGRLDPSGGLYVSKDNGITYTRLLSLPNSFIFRTSVAANSYTYFNVLLDGFYMYDGNNIKKLFNDGMAGTSAPYIIAKNGAIILSAHSPYLRYFN